MSSAIASSSRSISSLARAITASRRASRAPVSRATSCGRASEPVHLVDDLGGGAFLGGRLLGRRSGGSDEQDDATDDTGETHERTSGRAGEAKTYRPGDAAPALALLPGTSAASYLGP